MGEKIQKKTRNKSNTKSLKIKPGVFQRALHIDHDQVVSVRFLFFIFPGEWDIVVNGNYFFPV